MNIVAVVHLIAACIIVMASQPLIRGRVKMNDWYGIRIPQAFESEERWREINCYGGRLFLAWGIVVGVVAVCGIPLPRDWWITYNLAAIVPIIGGLLATIALIRRHAKRRT